MKEPRVKSNKKHVVLALHDYVKLWFKPDVLNEENLYFHFTEFLVILSLTWKNVQATELHDKDDYRYMHCFKTVKEKKKTEKKRERERK